MAPSAAKPWHAHITIDLIARVLNRSLLHPFVVWMIPLCLRAVATPYDAPDFIVACAWASFVTFLAAFDVIDHRIAYGAPREVDWEEEMVVITGGSNGLGRILAQTYGMRGASVAVLDVDVPDSETEGLAGVSFYRCDVSDAQQVERARREIEKDFGSPTILINNAAVSNGKPLLSKTPEEIRRSLSINLLGPFYTLSVFLPGMLAATAAGDVPGVTLVTVSSVLGKLGASHLTDYAAAKAGLIAMHRSLRAELGSARGAPDGSENVRMILVTPGQMGTRLFEAVRSPNAFFGPVVEPVELAREIVRLIDAGESGEVSLPLYARYVEWMGVLPVSLQRIVRALTGVDRAMEEAMERSGETSAGKAVIGTDGEKKKR